MHSFLDFLEENHSKQISITISLTRNIIGEIDHAVYNEGKIYNNGIELLFNDSTITINKDSEFEQVAPDEWTVTNGNLSYDFLIET